MSSDPIQLDPSDIIDALRARSVQTISDLLDEVARLTAYARTLEKRLADQTQPDPFDQKERPT